MDSDLKYYEADLKNYEEMVTKLKESVGRAQALGAWLKDPSASVDPKVLQKYARNPLVERDQLASEIKTQKMYIKDQEYTIANYKKKIEEMEFKEHEAASKDPSELNKARLAKLEKKYSTFIDEIRGNPFFQTCGMSEAEMLAIAVYSGSGYGHLNKMLRNGRTRRKKSPCSKTC